MMLRDLSYVTPSIPWLSDPKIDHDWIGTCVKGGLRYPVYRYPGSTMPSWRLRTNRAIRAKIASKFFLVNPEAMCYGLWYCLNSYVGFEAIWSNVHGRRRKWQKYCFKIFLHLFEVTSKARYVLASTESIQSSGCCCVGPIERSVSLMARPMLRVITLDLSEDFFLASGA